MGGGSSPRNTKEGGISGPAPGERGTQKKKRAKKKKKTNLQLNSQKKAGGKKKGREKREGVSLVGRYVQVTAEDDNGNGDEKKKRENKH